MSEIEDYRIEQAERYMQAVAKSISDYEAVRRQEAAVSASIDGLKGIDYSRVMVASSGMEHGDDAVMDIIERLDTIRDSMLAKAAEAAEVRLEWLGVRGNLTRTSADVLELYFLDGNTWDRVAERVNYSDGHIMKVRRRALLELYWVMPLTWRDRGEPAI